MNKSSTLLVRNVRLSHHRIDALIKTARTMQYKAIIIDNARSGEGKISAMIELIVTALRNSPGLRELKLVHCSWTLSADASNQLMCAIKHSNLRHLELEGVTDGSAFSSRVRIWQRLSRHRWGWTQTLEETYQR